MQRLSLPCWTGTEYPSLHRYTRGLFNSIPGLRDSKRRPTTVDEIVQNPAEFKRLPGFSDGIVPWWSETPASMKPQTIVGKSDYVLHEIEPNRWVGVWRSEQVDAKPSRRPELEYRRESVANGVSV